MTARHSPTDHARMFAVLPTPYLVMDPHLVIVDANRAYLASTGRTLDDIVGRGVFDAFPPAPEAMGPDGRSLVQASMERSVATREPETMPLQQYPIAGPDGELEHRSWLLVHVPVLGDDGDVLLLVQRAEDVTTFVRARGAEAAAPDGGPHTDEAWQRRAEQFEADLFARAQELAAALAAKDKAATRLARLAQVALALNAARTVDELAQVVLDRGLAVLGADGGAVVVPAADGGWQVVADTAIGAATQVPFAHQPYDSPLPACRVARTGERVLLPDHASAVAFHPVMEQVRVETGRRAWASLPLGGGDQRLGCLAVSWVEDHPLPDDEVEVLEGFAAQCSQTLERILAAEALRVNAEQVQELAGALQQALLTPPPEPDHLHIVVRYRPAADIAQVGGDWYDAFMQPDGATMLVIGDVMGHDGVAAAKMGQLRGLLRALAFAADDSSLADTPAAILTRVEHAARGLAVDTLATAVLARIERVPDLPVAGRRTLRWSNAGHPPPVLLHPDGRTELLDRDKVDLLLGVDAGTPRGDHTVELEDGSTVLFYTDGLVERRGESLDHGLAELERALAGLHAVPLDDLCDTVLARLAPHTGEDDIALVAVRTYAEDVPRPAEAGPNRTPVTQSDY